MLSSIARPFVLLTLLLGCAAGCGRDGILPCVKAADDPATKPAAGGGADKADAKAPTGRRYALLIGCTKYPSLREHLWLKGPANDVKEFRRVLTTRYRFKDDDVKILAEGAGEENRPTRKHIVDEFDRLVNTAGPGDQVFVLLSGHGSQQPDHPNPNDEDPEPDGLDEIFLPADIGKWVSDKEKVANAIVDDEILNWTSGITEKGASLWIIFDSCHSGTAIRGDSEEVAREADPEEDLGIPAQALRKAEEAAVAASGERTRGVGPREKPFDVKSQKGQVVAFYAAQSYEPAIELPMPPAGEAGEGPRTRHGLLAYTLLNILEQADAGDLTYRDLGAQVWAKYKGWRRTYPTPFSEGTDLDKLVFGTGRARFPYRIVSGDGMQGWKISGGQIHGLTPHTILAVRKSADAKELLGHVEVAELQFAEGIVKPREHEGTAAPRELPAGAVCTPVLIDYGDLRLLVAVDGRFAGAGAQERLTRLESELRKLENSPAEKDHPAVFRVAPFDKAEWVVQARGDGLYLLPKDVAQIEDDAKIPPTTPRFPLGAEHPASWASTLLERIFRAQNLVRLAGDLRLSGAPRAASDETPRGDADDGIQVEMLSYPSKGDRKGKPIDVRGAVPRLLPGQWVGWRVTNNGREAVDLTLLYIDSEFVLQPVFPRRAFGVDNRLGHKQSYATPPAEVTATPMGTEHLVVIAERRGELPQRNFWFLTAESAARARGGEARRGDADSALTSRLGRLLQYAAFNDPDVKERGGLNIADSQVRESSMKLLSWVVEARKRRDGP